MLHFANLIIPALIVLPSLTFLVWPPRNAPPPEDKREQWLLQAAEQVGRVVLHAIPLLVSSVIFAAAHIAVSLHTYDRMLRREPPE